MASRAQRQLPAHHGTCYASESLVAFWSQALGRRNHWLASPSSFEWLVACCQAWPSHSFASPQALAPQPQLPQLPLDPASYSFALDLPLPLPSFCFWRPLQHLRLLCWLSLRLLPLPEQIWAGLSVSAFPCLKLCLALLEIWQALSQRSLAPQASQALSDQALSDQAVLEYPCCQPSGFWLEVPQVPHADPLDPLLSPAQCRLAGVS